MDEELQCSERKEFARLLYTRLDIAVADVALSTGADIDAVRTWIREGAWDTQQRTLLSSKTKQLEHLYAALGQLDKKIHADNEDGQKEINLKDVDLYVKYTAAIKNLEVNMPMSNILEVSAHFITWLRRQDAELAKKVSTQLDAFMKHRASARLY